MLDEVSIQRQLHKEKCFSPSYCPNSKCENHLKPRASFFTKHGLKALKRFPYQSQRFRCKICDRTFSFSLFSIHYRQKIWGCNKSIWDFHQLGVAKRETARRIGHNEKMVRIRLRNMARWIELKHAKITEDLKINEPIVYDGLENFSYSQFDPNNINQAVGKNSLFIYDFNFAPLNRKGRMSFQQEKRKIYLDRKYGIYPTNAIRTSTRAIFSRLVEKSQNRLVLYSDKHFQYRRVVEEDLKNEQIEHIKISSKIHRNYQNPLFAVNNIDLQARHNLAAFKRETIAFSKHEIAMQDSFCLYSAYRNYMRPKFWGTHRSDPESSKKTPAMQLGLTTKILSFAEFFSHRVLLSQVKLNPDALDRYLRKTPTSRRKIAEAPSFC